MEKEVRMIWLASGLEPTAIAADARVTPRASDDVFVPASRGFFCSADRNARSIERVVTDEKNSHRRADGAGPMHRCAGRGRERIAYRKVLRP